MIHLASLLTLAQYAEPRTGWAPVVVLILIGILFAVGTVVASTLIGPGRTGRAKEMPYEAGMSPIGDTHRRFNVRFYVVAMIFLVFDVEIVFLYPWATVFPVAPTALLLGEILVFILILLIAYAYAWGKGVFRWS